MLRGSGLSTEVVYVERERPVNRRWFMLRGSDLSTEGGLC